MGGKAILNPKIGAKTQGKDDHACNLVLREKLWNRLIDNRNK